MKLKILPDHLPDQLQQLLTTQASGGQPASGGPDTQPTSETLQRSLQAANWLQAHQAGLALRPEFLPASRRRLLARIRSQARRSWWQGTWARPQVRLVLNSAALLVFAFTIIVFNLNLFSAAQVALPGEVLYPFKLGLEQARLAFTTSESQRAGLYVAFARQRSNELQALILEGEYARLEITSLRLLQLVDQANQHLSLAQDLTPAQQLALSQDLATTLYTQHLVLRALLSSVPAESQPVVNFMLLAAY